MSRKKNTQRKLINELKNQLMIQAERLGVSDQYTPIFAEEIKIDSVRKILTEFYMERSNLEYELNILGSNKKEVLIKLERLNAYVRKAEGLREKHCKQYSQQLEKGLGDQVRTRRAVSKLNPVTVRACA
jgi:hypothetical protein